MANTATGNTVRWDTITGAALTGRCEVNCIVITAGATGGATTLTDGGVVFLTIAMPANTTYVIPFSTPQTFDSLTMTAVGTNTAVTIFFA